MHGHKLENCKEEKNSSNLIIVVERILERRKYYNCEKRGHVEKKCNSEEIIPSHQKEQPKEKQNRACMKRRSPYVKYNSPFYGYTF